MMICVLLVVLQVFVKIFSDDLRVAGGIASACQDIFTN